MVTGELRFKVGSRVKCRVDSGWAEGVVLKIWDDGNPYRVRLNKDKVEVWAPLDEDVYIRAA